MTENAWLVLAAAAPGALASIIATLMPLITKWLEGRQSLAQEHRDYQREALVHSDEAIDRVGATALAVLLWFQQLSDVDELTSRVAAFQESLSPAALADDRVYRLALRVHEAINELHREVIGHADGDEIYGQGWEPGDGPNPHADTARAHIQQGGRLQTVQFAVAELLEQVRAHRADRLARGGVPAPLPWWPIRGIRELYRRFSVWRMSRKAGQLVRRRREERATRAQPRAESAGRPDDASIMAPKESEVLQAAVPDANAKPEAKSGRVGELDAHGSSIATDTDGDAALAEDPPTHGAGATRRDHRKPQGESH